MGRQGADGARVQQVADDPAHGNAAFRAVRPLEDFVQQVDEYASGARPFRGVDDAFQTRECRHEVGQPELERILDPDAGLQIAGRHLQTNGAYGSASLGEHGVEAGRAQ